MSGLVAGPSIAGGFISKKDALHRANVVVFSGPHHEQFRQCASDDLTYDLRKYLSGGSFGSDSNLSIGKDCAAERTAVVGGSVKGTISHSLTWDEVKSKYDADGLRLEGKDWLASFDLSVKDIEDGLAPRVTEGTEGGNTVRFLLAGAYMNWIRDDAIEDDSLMSGVIRDVLIDGTNRFLSARPSSSSSYTNTGMVVEVKNVLVHMMAMPNDRDSVDGVGFGGIFKWSDAAGKVDVSDSIFLLDEQPLSDDPFPAGTYSHVTLVLGPDFQGSYPGSLPHGVKVTRKMSVWGKARRAWLKAH